MSIKQSGQVANVSSVHESTSQFLIFIGRTMSGLDTGTADWTMSGLDMGTADWSVTALASHCSTFDVGLLTEGNFNTDDVVNNDLGGMSVSC